MSTQQPPPPNYGQQPQQGYYPPQQPPKKSHTLRNVLLVIAALFVLAIGGCLAVVGVGVNAVDDAIKESEAEDREPGGPDNPLEITVGDAFTVNDFDYDAGWTVGSDFADDVDIKQLKVTNTGEEADEVIVEIKFWQGNEVLAKADCSSDQIDPDTKVTVNCFSTDDLPKNYNRVTINETF